MNFGKQLIPFTKPNKPGENNKLRNHNSNNNNNNIIMEETLRRELDTLAALLSENVNRQTQLMAQTININRQHLVLVQRHSIVQTEIHRLRTQLDIEQEFIATKKELDCRQDSCGICLVSHQKRIIGTLSCGHSFGQRCIKSWFKKKGTNECPLCKARVSKMTCYAIAPVAEEPNPNPINIKNNAAINL